MLDAGVRGSITGDGRFQTPDGKTIGVSAEMAQKSDYARRGARVLVTAGGPLSEKAMTKAAMVLQTEIRKLQKQKATADGAGLEGAPGGSNEGSAMATAMKRKST